MQKRLASVAHLDKVQEEFVDILNSIDMYSYIDV
jgi:hypothetical protein